MKTKYRTIVRRDNDWNNIKIAISFLFYVFHCIMNLSYLIYFWYTYSAINSEDCSI
jgi:hypothetical protein